MLPPDVLGNPLPWTEQDYLALGETTCRIELVDGGLLIGPPPAVRHQVIVGNLLAALRPGCATASLTPLPVINLRLEAGRILNPDLVVLTDLDFHALCVPAAAVQLVGEVTAPHTAATDKVLKMHYYAAAGIEWYLLIDQESLAIHLYQRQGTHYVERSVTKAGEALELTEPVRATIRPEDLLG
ncbi:Uma2 family endonuclease [Micromonospora phytophila]|uniref:Uma2 family endonuclease n=1 Tax=Micromonospora phytophila TaxID=709888 RepID=UPI00202E7115|nr:Uma2 family endonuclease [Micromonospora phytophila]MCM0673829.1 Uma2 family endonuclease [Micromonospora phytophila]